MTLMISWMIRREMQILFRGKASHKVCSEFVMEMKIPYKSIQYDESLTVWGLDFDRWVALQREDQYWCPFEENEGQRVSRFGQLQFQDFRPTVQAPLRKQPR